YDLMEASVSSMTDDNNLYIDDGLDGFPAFGFRPGSEVKQPYRLYLPEKLPAEFTLVATFKPTSFRTSYLFAVLNPFETVVQLGIRISDGPGSNQNISLVYTNSDEHSLSEEVAKFTVPKLTRKWSKIVIKVSAADVTFYLNCHEMARQRVTRIPQKLVFDTASTLYIAQAGPHIQERYDVSTPDKNSSFSVLAVLARACARARARTRRTDKERKKKGRRKEERLACRGRSCAARRCDCDCETKRNETKRTALVAREIDVAAFSQLAVRTQYERNE
ncbi:Collagen alpha-1(XV) chain, partial [Harpegnathos saltator]